MKGVQERTVFDGSGSEPSPVRPRPSICVFLGMALKYNDSFRLSEPSTCPVCVPATESRPGAVCSWKKSGSVTPGEGGTEGGPGSSRGESRTPNRLLASPVSSSRQTHP